MVKNKIEASIDPKNDIQSIYKLIKNDIGERLKEFNEIWRNGDEDDVFTELVFCLMTPQSKARSCWDTVELVKQNKILFEADGKELCSKMNRVRFRNTKAKNIVYARELFIKNKKIIIKKKLGQFKTTTDAREWLVENVRGMGYKEASHFLRNIGLGSDLAILDRHILKNLKLLGVIQEVPKTLSKNKYLELEERTRKFSNDIGIPVDHLDLLLWYKETGEIFK